MSLLTWPSDFCANHSVQIPKYQKKKKNQYPSLASHETVSIWNSDTLFRQLYNVTYIIFFVLYNISSIRNNVNRLANSNTFYTRYKYHNFPGVSSKFTIYILLSDTRLSNRISMFFLSLFFTNRDNVFTVWTEINLHEMCVHAFVLLYSYIRAEYRQISWLEIPPKRNNLFKYFRLNLRNNNEISRVSYNEQANR